MLKNFYAALVLALGLGLSFPAYSDATVFGHFTATDNGDACLTPEEVHGSLKDYPEFELALDIKGEEITKLRKVLGEYYNLKPEELVPFDEMEFYLSSTDPSVVTFVLYNTGCYSVMGKMTIDDFENITKSFASPGIKLTNKGRLGFNPKAA
jgi:hypothetical protein